MSRIMTSHVRTEAQGSVVRAIVASNDETLKSLLRWIQTRSDLISKTFMTLGTSANLQTPNATGCIGGAPKRTWNISTPWLFSSHNFSSQSPICRTERRTNTHDGSNYAIWRRKVPYWGLVEMSRQQWSINPKHLKISALRALRNKTEKVEWILNAERTNCFIRTFILKNGIAGSKAAVTCGQPSLLWTDTTSGQFLENKNYKNRKRELIDNYLEATYQMIIQIPLGGAASAIFRFCSVFSSSKNADDSETVTHGWRMFAELY